MTLGQKLKALLKDNSMTQEDLAERLEVSRQAVGKWVNDKGIPEVGKLVQISNLFGVSLDYLLKEDCEEKNILKEQSSSDSGYYVSQEMLDGYLSYSRQNVKQITGGISLFVLSNVFDCFGYHSMIISFLYWLTMIAGIIIIVWYFFQTKQYQEIKNERLAFDDKVFGEFKKQRENRRKRYAVMIIVGVVILFASSEIGYFLMAHFGQTACNVFEWIADTTWIALIIWAGMSMHIDSIIINNTEHTPKSGHMKRYRWIYMALPVTVIAVLIGIITDAWSPYTPIIVLFCCLLVTTCKLLIESRGKDE
jgi:transcriptional regulator with XRE-family HTH domain